MRLVFFNYSTCSFILGRISEIIGCSARKSSRKTFSIPSCALPLAICHRTYLSRLIPGPLCLQMTANDGKESDSIRWHHVQSRMRMTGVLSLAQSTGYLMENSQCLRLLASRSSLLAGSLVWRGPLPAMVSDTRTSCPARSLSDSAAHLWS